MLKILKTGPSASLRRIIFIAALAVVSSVESLSAGNPQEPDANAATTSIPVTELIAGLKATESAIQCLSVEYTVESSHYFTKPGEPLSDEVLEGHLIQDDAVAFFMKGTALFVATADGRLRNQLDSKRTSQRFDKSEVHRSSVILCSYDDGISRSVDRRTDSDGTVSVDIRKSTDKTWYSPNPMHFTVNHHDDPVSGILEKHGGRVIGTMTWDDSKAVVFETKPVTRDNGYQSRRRYWIDPTRGYIVVRRQFLQPQNEGGRWTVSDQIDGRQHKEVQPGIWLPTKVEMTNYWVPKDEVRHMTGKDVVEISEWRVNEEFPDDYFELGPTEYEVQDQDQREVRP